MDNKAYIWLVNAHSQCHCTHENAYFVFLPFLLGFSAFIVFHSSVITPGTDACGQEELSEGSALLAGAGIYDARS